MRFTEFQKQVIIWSVVISGLFYCLVVPPFQTVDEFNHQYKIYHLAQGNFYAEIDTPTVSLGGSVPTSLKKISAYYEDKIVFPELKIEVDSICHHLTLSLEKDNKTFISFPNTARYSFTSYLSTVPIVYVSTKMDINPLYTMYFGRIFNFLFWVGCIFLGYRIMPFFGDLYLILCLIPGTICFHASLSADNVSNGLLFIMMALFFNFRFSDKRISNDKLFLFFLLTLIVTWNKIIYFPFLFLLLLVPERNFITGEKKYFYITALFLSSMAVVLFWSNKVDEFVYPFGTTGKNTYHNLHLINDSTDLYYNVNPRLQMEIIKQDPVKFAAKLIPAVFELYSYNNRSYFSSVGWNSVRINILLHTFLVGILICYILNLDKIFTPKERWFFVFMVYGISALFLLSQHLHWDAFGMELKRSYLGKYFIALYPFLFFAISGLYKIHHNKYLTPKVITNVMIITFILAHLNTAYIIFERYYF